MMQTGNREITVDKNKLITIIKKNKKAHVKSYKEAVSQLEQQLANAKAGSLTIRLELVTPINNEKNYDSIIDMFKWDVNDQVTLSQREFKEYVRDETQFAREALFSNTVYSQKSKRKSLN